MKYLIRLGIGVVVLAIAAGAAVSAYAEGPSGTLVGNNGGSYQTWSVTAPAKTDVTLTLNHWPCLTGKSVGFNVWGMSGKVASSWEKDACTQSAKFNTGDGGWHEIQLYNYDHGLGVWWSLMAEGLDLSTATAPMAAAAPAAPAVVAATTATTTTLAAAAAPAVAAAPAAAAAPAVPTGDGTLSAAGIVFGDSGGAYANHSVMVKEGTKYHAKMTVGTDAGGTWKGIGFNVWGPGGLITTGWNSSHNVVEADFTADGNVMYLIQPFNYHHGVTAWYALEVMPK